MKILIYGMGKIFHDYESIIDWSSVVAIADKKATGTESYRTGIPIIAPQQIEDYEYDFLVIVSTKFFESIKNELIGIYCVPESKIVSWTIFEDKSNFNGLNEILFEFIRAKNISKILEPMQPVLGESLLYRLAFKYFIQIDGIDNVYTSEKNNSYNSLYKNIDEVKQEYDLILIKGELKAEDFINIISKIKFKFLIYIEAYSFQKGIEVEQIGRHINMSNVRTFKFPSFMAHVYENTLKEEIDCNIYVVTHKQYNIAEDEHYLKLCVGSAYREENALSECTGKNISEYNNRLNECTALYWIWKNTKSEYVGLNHYRRYFLNNNIMNHANRLKPELIRAILCEQNYDIILPNLLTLPFTVYDNIKNTVGENYADSALQIIKKLISERQPDYLWAFESVMSGNFMYVCNMFITKREILNQFCEWLFSFIVDAAERLDVSLANEFQKRTIGYYAETMWTCWLLKQNLKIYELPITKLN